jgi:hypothetical protein
MKKSKPPKIDLTGYRYAPALPAIEFMSYSLINPIMRLGLKEYWKYWKLAPSLTELTAFVGVDLENQQYAKAISTHQNRMRGYFAINGLISVTLYLFIGLLVLAFIVFAVIFMSRGKLPSNISKYTSWVSTVLFLFVLFAALRLAGRISSTILDRYYADSLAYSACLNLYIHLLKENSLMLTRDRQHLLIRIQSLRRYLILLSYQYPTSELGSKNWALSQFKQMEAFVREKESQIIAPQADTQAKMSAELFSLLTILLTAQYGEFKYTSVSEAEEVASGQGIRTRGWLIRFLGHISPLILIAANYYFKDQFQAIGFDNQIVALVGLAWLLLALDAILNLGIVDRITGLAKAMSELR